MLTLLCRFRLPNQPQLQSRKTRPNRGQIIVIFAVTLLALIFFTGLAIDAGSLYVTYGQMRRAVDAAAVAAANDYKAEGVVGVVNRARMTKAALEVMKLHDLNETDMDLKVYLCDDAGTPAEFQAQCPVPPDSPRKLVWIDATQTAPLYFLSLMGFQAVPLRAHAIAEAAPIDLVIVIDTSESMANGTPGYSAPFDPATCNSATALNGIPPCNPLNKAKLAAKGLIETLYNGYDHVAIVHYDVTAPAISAIPMRTSLADAENDVNALRVHDDPPYTKIQPRWFSVHKAGVSMLGFNPVYPEDRDGNGLDADPDPKAQCVLVPPTERWDDTVSPNPFGLDEAGIPCDDATVFDSYDWDGDGSYTLADDTYFRTVWLPSQGCADITNNPGACKPAWTYLTPNSTCTGCGIRAGAEVLKRDGRANAVWVMVFLSDGLVNLSDTPATNSSIPSAFPIGFCKGGIGSYAWGNDCVDINKTANLSPRHCLDNPATTCPPGSISALDNLSTPYDETADYTVYDYALDMVDYAALQKSANPLELSGTSSGSDIAIYAIGLGDAGGVPTGASGPIGEYLLRYMAAVGDDGERLPDPCATAPTQTNCGQYYYTATGTGLGAIFNDISTRIYSRLTQ